MLCQAQSAILVNATNKLTELLKHSNARIVKLTWIWRWRGRGERRTWRRYPLCEASRPVDTWVPAWNAPTSVSAADGTSSAPKVHRCRLAEAPRGCTQAHKKTSAHCESFSLERVVYLFLAIQVLLAEVMQNPSVVIGWRQRQSVKSNSTTACITFWRGLKMKYLRLISHLSFYDSAAKNKHSTAGLHR